MLCDDVRRTVYFFFDGSLAEPNQRDFKSHLDLCPDCDQRTKAQYRIRSFVLKRLTPQQPAPEKLKTRLARSLRAFRDEWQREL
jgi:mycothiol system anti-sigma-R factor